jgi:bifunctional UDP-N-acetylglucosamine pyrophosphorylase/glucosamine-1-phosphate N-acetyltransferase
VAQCLPALEDFEGTVLVLSGDTPCVQARTLLRLAGERIEAGADAAVLTGHLENPFGYGRILRDSRGLAAQIREQKDLEPGEEEITEVNLGVYSFEATFLRREIPRLTDDNAQGEYYLTDLVKSAAAGSGVITCAVDDPDEARGINTLEELAAMEAKMNQNHVLSLMDSGVRIIDPDNTWIDDSVVIEPGAEIRPMTFLHGATKIGSGSTVGPNAVITDTIIGRNVEIRPFCVVTGARVYDDVSIGPFAHLRPGSDIGPSAKIGNYVETKEATVGEGSKISHLTYIGDTVLGRGVNIGAGCVTCNYDGFSKYQTRIGDGVFVGSGTMMVAPVELGEGCLVAAGSTITKDVPADALAVARGRQTVKEAWAAERRKRLASEKKERKS